MKKAFIPILLLLLFFSADAKDTLDVTKDIKTYLSASLRNIHGDSVRGDYQTLQDISDYNHNVRHDSNLNLKVPDGAIIRLDTSFRPFRNISITFSIKSRVISTSLLQSGADVIHVIAQDSVRIYNMQYTNYQVKYIDAVIRFDAYPKICKGNKVIGSVFKNIWATAAIHGSYIGDGDSTHYQDSMKLLRDTIINNFNPGYPHMLFGSDYHTNRDCAGIDIVNANKHLEIAYCLISNTGGDGIDGLGLSKEFSHQADAGTIKIHHNRIEYNNFQIEINGNYLPNGLEIYQNTLLWPQYPGGYNISTQGKGLLIWGNTCKSADNGIFELSFAGGRVYNNKCYQYMWKRSSMGYRHAPFATGSSRMPAVYIYGFMGEIDHNSFWTDTAGKSHTSPGQLMGVSFVTTASNGDTAFDRNSFGPYVGIMGGHYVHHNTFTGQTDRIIDNSNQPCKNILFEQNTIRTANLSGSDALFWIKGDSVTIRNNTISASCSSGPKNSSVKIVYKVQGTGEQVTGNLFKGNSVWITNTPNYIFKH